MNMNMTSSGLQCEVAYWPAMTLGGAAQVVAAHCLNERTLDPAVCRYNRPTYAPASRTMACTPQCSPATTRYFLVTSITRYFHRTNIVYRRVVRKFRRLMKKYQCTMDQEL